MEGLQRLTQHRVRTRFRACQFFPFQSLLVLAVLLAIAVAQDLPDGKLGFIEV
jgi:hypothetical protein